MSTHEGNGHTKVIASGIHCNGTSKMSNGYGPNPKQYLKL